MTAGMIGEDRMCQFFSFCTEPEGHGGKRYYFDWTYRAAHLADDNMDSHSFICKHYELNEDVCNKYEFNPLTKVFNMDMINSPVDDRIQAEDWVNRLDFKRVIDPLIIKPIVNPLELPLAEVTEQDKQDLKLWASVWASVRASVGAYISTFFAIEYEYDLSPAIRLWERGIVASFDGKTWRLHSGKDAQVIYQINKEELETL
jgi:hypothetical protein